MYDFQKSVSKFEAKFKKLQTCFFDKIILLRNILCHSYFCIINLKCPNMILNFIIKSINLITFNNTFESQVLLICMLKQTISSFLLLSLSKKTVNFINLTITFRQQNSQFYHFYSQN